MCLVPNVCFVCFVYMCKGAGCGSGACNPLALLVSSLSFGLLLSRILSEIDTQPISRSVFLGVLLILKEYIYRGSIRDR